MSTIKKEKKIFSRGPLLYTIFFMAFYEAEEYKKFTDCTHYTSSSSSCKVYFIESIWCIIDAYSTYIYNVMSVYVLYYYVQYYLLSGSTQLILTITISRFHYTLLSLPRFYIFCFIFLVLCAGGSESSGILPFIKTFWGKFKLLSFYDFFILFLFGWVYHK